MAKIVLVHWNAREWDERADRLRRTGHSVSRAKAEEGGAGLRELRASPPDAVVIDLNRLPSHGRAVGVALRQQKATRNVPLIFLEGEPEKVAKVREQLPDVVYSTWPRIRSALREALRPRAGALVVPRTMDAYSTTPLPKKLGIKAGSNVVLLGAPADFAATLGELPQDARLLRGGRTQGDVVMLFVRSVAELRRRLAAGKKALAPRARLWIAWPKKTSGVASDLSERHVRETGLAAGLVDFKIAAIDNTWSGLCFSPRVRKA